MTHRRFGLIEIGVLFATLMFSPANGLIAKAQEAEQEDSHDVQGTFDVLWRTLGGKQFWGDRLVYFDWRIQQHALDGHYRLLDPTDHRHASGTFDECFAKLKEIRAERKLPPMKGKAVILLHGLFRTRGAMKPLANYLNREGGYVVLSVGYATTRGTVADHAAGLASVMQHLDEIEEVNFVAHSLGNLVIRHYLGDDAALGREPDQRIKRIVMLGPPNQEPELAVKLIPIDVTKQITGPAAGQLARTWAELAPRLATPAVDFGILAGGTGNDEGRNPVLPGDDDFIVTVASTRLPGARDFRVLPVWHTTMMNDERVQGHTLRFLAEGHFESDEKRQPIAAE